MGHHRDQQRPLLVDHEGLDKLSPREEEVLSLATTGLLDKQISSEMGVTLNTLRTYWTRIRTKAGEVPRSALAAAYTERRTSRPRPLVGGEPASWEIDLKRSTIHFYGDREFLGEMDMEEVYERIHPEDAPRVRALVEALRDEPTPPFTYVARMVTDHGLELASAYVEVMLNEHGKPSVALGRHVALMDLTSPRPGDFSLGRYRRDLKTGEIWMDEGFRQIYRVTGKEDGVLETIFSRYHPDYVHRIRTLADEMAATGRERFRRTFRLRFQDGEELWLSSEVKMDFVDGEAVSVSATLMAYR